MMGEKALIQVLDIVSLQLRQVGATLNLHQHKWIGFDEDYIFTTGVHIANVFPHHQRHHLSPEPPTGGADIFATLPVKPRILAAPK